MQKIIPVKSRGAWLGRGPVKRVCSWKGLPRARTALNRILDFDYWNCHKVMPPDPGSFLVIPTGNAPQLFQKFEKLLKSSDFNFLKMARLQIKIV